MRLCLRLIEEILPTEADGINRLRKSLETIPSLTLASEISVAARGGYAVVVIVPDSEDIEQLGATLAAKGYRFVI